MTLQNGFAARRLTRNRRIALAAIVPLLWAVPLNADDWPRFSHDYNNSNYSDDTTSLNAGNARYLRRAWEVFNDDTYVATGPPTGFALEAALGLEFPAAVVGVVAGPIVRDSTIYYVDELGTLFARDATGGGITNNSAHWTTTLVDPDFDSGSPPAAPELFYTAPIVTDDYV
ncbi:MAG TPA: hypothetical protein P5081_14515 [Phycisphaerae bacterium]|nr:hypothetical protein [Phycisphaerae bacterium]HRW54083.1 hypothetical protein [Phycisphaerae bacterium]